MSSQRASTRRHRRVAEKRRGLAGLGWHELVIVLVIVMIIFGAAKLPEIAKSLGQGVQEFRAEADASVAR